MIAADNESSGAGPKPFWKIPFSLGADDDYHDDHDDDYDFLLLFRCTARFMSSHRADDDDDSSLVTMTMLAIIKYGDDDYACDFESSIQSNGRQLSFLMIANRRMQFRRQGNIIMAFNTDCVEYDIMIAFDTKSW